MCEVSSQLRGRGVPEETDRAVREDRQDHHVSIFSEFTSFITLRMNKAGVIIWLFSPAARHLRMLNEINDVTVLTNPHVVDFSRTT